MPEELGRGERKKLQRHQEYKIRRKMWLDRYGSADALRSTFGSGPPWGDLSPQQTRVFYHALLPRSLLALSEMGLMKPDELAPLAYAARIAAKEYARSRCIWTGRLATAAFDQYRSLRDRGRFLAPGSSSSMSWEEVWGKYEAQIVEEECAEEMHILKKKRRWKNKKLDQETLTMRIYMRILERSCATNKVFDSLFLLEDGDMDSDLAAISAQLEEDIQSILLSPKESSKREKKIGRINKKLEKEREKERKMKRRAEKKERIKIQEKRNEQMSIDTRKRQASKTKEGKQDEEEDKRPLSEYSKRSEALRILSNTRRKFRIMFSDDRT